MYVKYINNTFVSDTRAVPTLTSVLKISSSPTNSKLSKTSHSKKFPELYNKKKSKEYCRIKR